MNGYVLCVEVYNGKGTVGTNREVVSCPKCGEVHPLVEYNNKLMCKRCKHIEYLFDMLQEWIVDNEDSEQVDEIIAEYNKALDCVNQVFGRPR